jgi:hypothetical protein
MIRSALLALLLCVGLSAHAQTAGEGAGAAEFDRGVAAYRAGDHAAALAEFEAARAAGLDTPQLRFNLGLSYYKLRRYEEARAAFERLRADPGYEKIAEFHLGLVAARLGDRATASTLWRDVAADPDPDMRQRAGVALGRLDTGRTRSGLSGYVLAGIGRDSNPALLDEDLPGTPDASRTTELFGAFDYRATNQPVGTVLQAGAYVRDYAENNGLDQRGVFGGFARERLAQRRRTAVGLDAAATWLDGEAFTRSLSLSGQTGPAAGRAGLGLKGQLSRIVTPEAYAHLDGWRAQATGEWTARSGRMQSRLGYTFELNDRADLATGTEFFSHSPLRHRLDLAVLQPVGQLWTLRWSARYRLSRYRDPNRFDDGGVLREERREEDLLQAGVQVRRSFGPAMSALIEYQYATNRSNFEALDYERHVTLVGVEWLPFQ